MKGKVSRGIVVGVSVGAVLFVASHLNKYGGGYEISPDSSAVIDLSGLGRSDPNLSRSYMEKRTYDLKFDEDKKGDVTSDLARLVVEWLLEVVGGIIGTDFTDLHGFVFEGKGEYSTQMNADERRFLFGFIDW